MYTPTSLTQVTIHSSPLRLKIRAAVTVCLFTDDYEDELQMAAATWDDASQVRVAPPTEFVAPPQTEGEENQDQVNFYIIIF